MINTIDVHLDLNPKNSNYSIDRIAFDILELGVESVRIPLRCKQLFKEDFSLENEAIEGLFNFQKYLNKEVEIHGYIYAVFPSMIEEYFYDRNSFREKWKYLISNLFEVIQPLLSSVEIWNEPNVSWSYLCRQWENSFRPWTPVEFIEDIIIPASNIIRQFSTEIPIVLGSLGEDGILGHNDRKPSFSGQLAKKHTLRQKFSERHPYYVIPNFLEGILENFNDLTKYIDAIGLHPYPYFNKQFITKGSISDSTIIKLRRTINILSNFYDNQIPLWITEVGARELDIDQNHLYSPDIQSLFLKNIIDFIQGTKTPVKIGKLFWYQYCDTWRDLKQEKPFGLIDYSDQPKRIFMDIKDYNYRNIIDNNNSYKTNNFTLIFNRSLSSHKVSQLFFRNNVLFKSHYGYFLPIHSGIIVVPGRQSSDKLNILGVGNLDLSSKINNNSLYSCMVFLEFDLMATNKYGKLNFVITSQGKNINLDFNFGQNSTEIVIDFNEANNNHNCETIKFQQKANSILIDLFKYQIKINNFFLKLEKCISLNELICPYISSIYYCNSGEQSGILFKKMIFSYNKNENY